MSKTKEELNQLKKEYETLYLKLKGLTENELKQVTGGAAWYGIDNQEGTLEPGSRLVSIGKDPDERTIK